MNLAGIVAGVRRLCGSGLVSHSYKKKLSLEGIRRILLSLSTVQPLLRLLLRPRQEKHIHQHESHKQHLPSSLTFDGSTRMVIEGHEVGTLPRPPPQGCRCLLSSVAPPRDLLRSVSRMPHPAVHIQIRARLTGTVQFQCPNCSNLNCRRRSTIDWRRGRVYCTRCFREYTVGLVFEPQKRCDPPQSGWFASVFAGWTANFLDGLPPGHAITARPVGTAWWICPFEHCKAFNRSQIDWGTGKVACSRCEACYYVSAVLYRVPGRSKRAPLDWSLPTEASYVPIPR